MGVNYKQIPVNQPKVPVHSYSKDGLMRVQKVSDPVYAPNSKGGPEADPAQYPQVEVWEASGEFVHAAYTKRKDDDDFGQAGTLVRKIMDNAQRDRLVSNVVGHLKNGVTEPVLARAIEYWRKHRPSRWRPYRQGRRRADGRRIVDLSLCQRGPLPLQQRSMQCCAADREASGKLVSWPLFCWDGPSIRRVFALKFQAGEIALFIPCAAVSRACGESSGRRRDDR